MFDAFGQPQYTAKCNTNSSISSSSMSPLFSAAYTCASIGAGASAAATHVNVTQRRSRRESPGRRQTPRTNSRDACSRGVVAGAGSIVMTSR